MRVAITIACFALLLGCASTPSWPQPEPYSGQILVHLDGKARQGVGGPKTEEAIGEYTITRESIEKGENFERVDYRAIEDVVVILQGAGQDALRGPGSRAELSVGNMMFSRQQVAMLPSAELSVRNERKSAVTIFGASDEDFFELTVAAQATAKVSVPKAGVYDLTCDEDETLSCTLFVVEGVCWIGPSSDSAFFNVLKPGKYTVHIHAPRLPARTRDLTVQGGKRETVTVDLSVNDLPKLKR